MNDDPEREAVAQYVVSESSESSESEDDEGQDTFLEMLEEDGGQLYTAMRRFIKYYLTSSFFSGYYNLYLWSVTAFKMSLLEEYSVVLHGTYWGFLVLVLLGFLNGLIPIDLPPQLFCALKTVADRGEHATMSARNSTEFRRTACPTGAEHEDDSDESELRRIVYKSIQPKKSILADVCDALRLASSDSKSKLEDNLFKLLAEDAATAGFRDARTKASDSVRAFVLAQPIFRMLVDSEREEIIETMQVSLLADIDIALQDPLHIPDAASCLGELPGAVIRKFMLDSEKHLLDCFMKLNKDWRSTTSKTASKYAELASLHLFEQNLLEHCLRIFKEYLSDQVCNISYLIMRETTLTGLFSGSARRELSETVASPVQLPALEEITCHFMQKVSGKPQDVELCTTDLVDAYGRKGFHDVFNIIETIPTIGTFMAPALRSLFTFVFEENYDSE
ncbi:hypothetical protein CYMTET_38741 [Cymbomonas tetramitiformis]|uniref:Uncharacterized protein n=1 Tax=Cymbomonas tetramitiformis TaxID=36881 RepID=A0AAE0CDH0_9CHLO|nr:hypothetical protein CYMTET_38741 [Cymbomonas tetramitiformis]